MAKSKEAKSFDAAMKALVQVPKTELHKAEREYQKARKKKRQRRKRK